MFVTIKRKLEVVRDNKKAAMDPLVRAAAHSSLMVLEKYMNLFEDSEVYWIALVMCPDRKLQWLNDNGYEQSDVNTVRNLVVHRFNTMYPALHTPSSELADGDSDDEWSLKPRRATVSSSELDSIEKYLATEPLSPEVYEESGPLTYWQSQMASGCRPRLAEFAISYLTAPASSVDAERAFSCGRLTIGHLQHNMSPESFCAKMALRSWYGAPLMHDIDDVAAVLEPERVE
ncbi:hypothetical protein FRC12_004249 [Ceratobasidium sp. 428]|nr:hypothetical protein FRC12_004249 [Ceratobasidium sp. 428]